MAAREHCGRFIISNIPIPPESFAGRVVSEFVVPEPDGPIGDLTHPDAVTSGATAEIHTTSNYWLTTRWAAVAHSNGYGALHYQARFTPGGETALALFGAAGRHPDRPIINTRPLLDVLADSGYDVGRSTLPSAAALAVRVNDAAEPEDA